MERQASKGDFYSNRVVKKNNSKLIVFKNNKIKTAEVTENALVEDNEIKQIGVSNRVEGQLIEKVITIIPEQMSNSSNINSRLSQKVNIINQINDLYQSSKEVKGFTKSYDILKQQKLDRFVKHQSKDDPQPMVIQTKREKGFSILSFVFSLVGIVFVQLLCGSAAIIFGAVALYKEQSLEGLAIAGIIIGVIDLIIALGTLGIIM